MERTKNKNIGAVLSELSMPILLLVLIIFFAIMSKNFFTPYNITNILVQNVHVAVCATAVMIIMISGGCDLSIGYQMSVAAVLLASRAGSADSSTGTGIEFTGITACVLSGVALKGGEGTLWKVIVAVFVLGVLSNGMQLINLGTYPQYIAKGVIMLLSLYMSNRNNN